MKNPGLTIAVLFLTTGLLALGLLRCGPRSHRDEPKIKDETGAATNKIVLETPTPSPLPTATPVEIQQEDSIILTPNLAIFHGDINGDWLILRRHKSYSGGEKGWEASFTSIESDYKPVVTRKGAKWEIVFSSDDLATEFQP